MPRRQVAAVTAIIAACAIVVAGPALAQQSATKPQVLFTRVNSSNYDPLDVSEYTFEEIKATVDVARTWNTYVAVHANTDDTIQMAIRAGIKSEDSLWHRRTV